MSEMPKYTTEQLNRFLNKNIRVKLINSMDDIVTRSGRLEYDDNWYYLYDENKSGIDFNVAINEKEVPTKLTSIEYIPPAKDPRLKQIHTTLSFLRSVIQLGEPMTEEVRSAINEAIDNTRLIDADLQALQSALI